MKDLLVGVFFACIVLSGQSPGVADVFTVPVSDSRLEGYFEPSDGSLNAFTVQEGGMLVIHESQDYRYAVVPVIRESSQVELVAFEISRQGSDYEAVDIGRTYASGGEALIGLPVGLFRIVVSGISTVKPQYEGIPLSAQGGEYFLDGGSGGVCCVTCGGITMCGSSVKMSCGACQAENQIM